MISQPARIVRGLAVIATATAMVSGCSSQPPAPHKPQQSRVSQAAPRPPNQQLGDRAAAVAVQQLGAPYRYGGSNPSGFDCSGLVHYAYAQVGKAVPRTTGALWDGARSVSSDHLQAGDLLFFSFSGKMSHVGLYVGDGRFIHAPSTGKHVTMENLRTDYYRKALLRAARPD